MACPSTLYHLLIKPTPFLILLTLVRDVAIPPDVHTENQEPFSVFLIPMTPDPRLAKFHPLRLTMTPGYIILFLLSLISSYLIQGLIRLVK
jgi:hypothetical protein